ncbi:MAG: bis(5'-nucleosyl)-tetraphosphatase (symmetrical) YqeK [Halanaerobiaceae bacterium]
MSQKNNIITKIKGKLKKKVGKTRYNHTLGVVEVAVNLAKVKAISREKALIAALLHDYTKNLTIPKIKKLCRASCWYIDPLEYSIPGILHAPASAYVARKKFGINDFDILEAIRFHTIGKPKIDILAQIIFAADVIEPNRNFSGIDKLRNTVNSNLHNGIILICEENIKYNIESNRIIHPNSLKFRNWLLEGNN